MQPFTPFVPPKRIDPPVPPPPAAARRASPVLAGLLLGLGAMFLGLLGAWLLRRRRPRPDAGLPDGTGMTAAQAEARAAAALAGADHDAALRWTFVAGLLRLDAAGALPYDPCRTTAECRVRLAPPLRRPFGSLARGFDLVAYGGRRATAPDVLAARAGWEALLAAATPAGRPLPAEPRRPVPA